LSDNEIIEEANKRIHNDELNRYLKTILDKCANISYAPVENSSDIKSDILLTRKLLKQLRAAL
jgi:hypothetical protein